MTDESQAEGLTGLVLDTVDALGAFGVGLMSFAEMVFPPIPSEIVLPLAGYQVQQGRIGLASALIATVLGAVLGSLVLYWMGKAIGIDRTARIAQRVPLMDASDVYRAAEWFQRHEGKAVFSGRFVPGVRSLVSLPAGSSRMRLPKFVVLTAAGTGLWNGFLIIIGMALGTQYELVEKYSQYIDYVFYAAIIGLVGFAVVRRVRQGTPVV